MNRLPLDNAVLKHQHQGVGRRLAHRQDERCVCGTEAKVNSQYYWWEGFWLGVTARHPCKMRSLVYKWILQQDGVPSHITRSTACVKVKMLTSSSWTLGHRTTQIWIRWTVLFEETLQKMVLQCSYAARCLKSLKELKSAIAARGKLNCHKRSLANRRIAASPWKCNTV